MKLALHETMKIETGNAHEAETKGTGWFVGFSDWTRKEGSALLHERHGDFAAWGEGLYHRWHCLSRATVLTIRWNPATAATNDETSA